MSNSQLSNFLKNNRLIEFSLFLITRIKQFEITNAAASLTLSSITALVPTITFLFFIFSTTSTFEIYSNELFNYISSFLEIDAFNAIVNYLQTLPQKISSLSIIGAVILLISVTLLMSVIETTFNRIWQVKKPRKLYLRIILYLIIIVVGPLAIAMTSSWWNLYFKNLQISIYFPVLASFLYALFSFILYTTLIFLMFRLIPYCFVPLSNALIGSILTAISLIIVKKIFIIYVHTFNNYEFIYGAFAAIPLFILYVYLLWYIILTGAIVTSSLSSFKNNAFQKQKVSLNQFENAIRVLSHLYKKSTRSKGVKIQELHSGINMGYDALSSLMDTLQKLGYIKKDLTSWHLEKEPQDIILNQLYHEFVLPDKPLQNDSCGEALYSLLNQKFDDLNLNLEQFMQLENEY